MKIKDFVLTISLKDEKCVTNLSTDALNPKQKNTSKKELIQAISQLELAKSKIEELQTGLIQKITEL